MGLKEAVKISGLNVPAKISGRGMQVLSTDCKEDPPLSEIPINLMITNMSHLRYIVMTGFKSTHSAYSSRYEIRKYLFPFSVLNQDSFIYMIEKVDMTSGRIFFVIDSRNKPFSVRAFVGNGNLS